MVESNLPLPPDPATDPDALGNPARVSESADVARQAPAMARPPAPKKRRRRRWPYVLLFFLLILGLVVLLAPTIAGTGPVRSVILGQVNQRLNGRVEVADWSIGWTSPVSVSGLKVFDKAGVQVLEVPRITTGLKLIDAARGRLHFGVVTVEGLNALVRRDVRGEINFAQLLPGGPEGSSVSKPQAAGGGETTLPDVRGELRLVDCRATFEDQLQGQTFFFPSIAGTVKCPDINGAIENALEIACKVGDAPAGRLTIAGRADVADGNVVRPERMDVDQKVTVRDVQLGGFAFALGKDAAIQKLTGLTSGTVSLRFKGSEGAGVEAEITSTGFAAGGPALKGDTFATQRLSLVVPPTTLAMPGGSDDWKSWALRVGSSGRPAQIALTIDQGSVSLAADATLQALANLADNAPPGAAGQIRADVDLDVGALSRQMPRVLAVRDGLTLSSGRFTHHADIQLAPDRATVKRLETRLVDVRGQRGEQPVSLQPINLAITASSFGGGWATPNVRDLNLTLDSGFASAAFAGRDLAAISGKATGDLKRLRDEVGQVFDLGDLQLAGPFDVQVASKGDVAAGANAFLSTTVTVTDLVVGTTKDQPPLRQSRVRLEAGGEVVRRADGSVEQLRGATVALSTGDAARPTVAARISIPSAVMASAGAAAAPWSAATQGTSAAASATYQVNQFAVDLAKAKAEFGEFLPALNEYAFDRGTVNVTGGGQLSSGALTYDGRVAVTDLTLARTPVSARGELSTRVEVIRGYTLTVDAGLTRTQQGQASVLDVTKLALGDERGMLSLKKAGDQPLRLVTTAAGAIQPSGKVDLAADLKQLSDVIDRLAAAGPDAVARGAQGPALQSGRLAGVLEFAQAAQGEFKLIGNLEGTALTVRGPGGDVLNNERVALVADVRAKDEFSAAFVDRLDVAGNLLTANISGTSLLLKVGQGDAARVATTAEMVQSATVKAQIPDLGKVQALLDALSMSEAPAAPVAAPRALAPPSAASALAAVLLAQAPPPDQVIGRRPPAPGAGQAPPAPPDSKTPPQAAAGGETEEAAPLKFTGGSASLSLLVRREGGRTIVTPEVNGQNIALAKGAGAHTLDAVNLKTSLSFATVAPPATVPIAATGAAPGRAPAAAAVMKEAAAPSLSEQIRDLRIPSLMLSAAGSSVTLVEPVVVEDPGGLGRLLSPPTDPQARAAAKIPATVKVALQAEGDVGQLSALLVALGVLGDPAGPKQPYAGRYDLEQRLAAGDNGLAATGKLNLSDFVVTGGSGFNEKAIRFANDITLDAAKDALSLRDVTLAMESTKALELKLGGSVLDYSTKRRLENVAGTIGYDWAKLWELIRPMLSKEQQESLKLRVAGQAQRQFAFGGSYPAVADDGRPLAFNEAIRFVTAHFEGGFQLVEINGIEVQNLELPLTLRDGKLTVAYHDRPEGKNLPAPADCNSGKLDIGGATVDLAEETPRLTIAKGQKLLSKATLNPVFSDLFGAMINNPMFVSPSEARGLVDVTVVECNRLPLDSLVLKTASQNDGRAEFLFSIDEVYLGTPKLLEALKLVGQSDFAGSLQGQIRESRVIIERGQTRQDVTINTGASDRPFRIRGSTALETSRLDLTVTIPPQLLRQLGSSGRQVAELLPDGLPIPLGGTTRAPQLDLNRAFTSALKEGLLPGLLRRATGDRRADPPPARDGTMPKDDAGADARRDPPPPEVERPAPDPVQDLFDQIGKQRQQKEKEKQEQRDRRRREREQGADTPTDARPAGGASGSDRIGRGRNPNR